MNKVALITGANQGLGFGLAQRLNELYKKNDTIYLGVRRPEAGQEAIEAIGNTNAQLEVIYIDISKEESVVEAKNFILEKHGGIDLLIGNAAQRLSQEKSNKDQVESYIHTNIYGTYSLLKHFQPILKNDAKFIIVASAFGSLLNLNESLHPLFNTDSMSLEDINKTMQDYVDDVKTENDLEKGWPEWINTPSKIGQVALMRIAAREEASNHPEKNTSIFSVCPGWVYTESSKPYIDSMGQDALSAYDAAEHIIKLVANTKDNFSGKLIQYAKEIPWN
ncbi:hypothetical protein DF185_04915 [Marinifilum breve]|uniref:Short-chain dehydrogenase n=1 Tax=Marinifilum breve TaxID=2184082 RepID=A0A2V4A0F2_9BACT|nr:SDR family NAD(P)-dependent oxidoreductase [Marinifilum breve]PXY01993.1 hypothetical protein DF185_04915 [Marinifilum breve]